MMYQSLGDVANSGTWQFQGSEGFSPGLWSGAAEPQAWTNPGPQSPTSGHVRLCLSVCQGTMLVMPTQQLSLVPMMCPPGWSVQMPTAHAAPAGEASPAGWQPPWTTEPLFRGEGSPGGGRPAAWAVEPVRGAAGEAELPRPRPAARGGAAEAGVPLPRRAESPQRGRAAEAPAQKPRAVRPLVLTPSCWTDSTAGSPGPDSSSSGLRTPSVSPRYTPKQAQDCWFHVPDQLSSDQAADTAAASLDARWVDADVAPEREEEETSLGFGAVEELPEDQFEELLHLLEDCNPDSRLAVLLRVTARALWRFASSAKGSRFLQEALERADAHGAVRLAAGLNGHVSEAWDSPTAAPHANHVVQVCLQALPPAQCHFVLDEMREGGVERAGCSKYGCRILQRIIEHFPAQDTSVFVEELLDPDVLLRLAVNRFGNFVVQCVLEHGTQVQRVRIADLLLDQDDQKFSRLCENMYASHVVQKAMKLCHEKLQELLLARIVRIERSDSKFKRSVYGSFVVHEARKLLKAAAAKAPTATPLAEANRGAMRRGGQGRRATCRAAAWTTAPHPNDH
uniref:PUM-HD domain-containing protein n=1 Tax=Alexandrium monilatum TaxID=311494 RepID=A0A7S4RXB8_9DINO